MAELLMLVTAYVPGAGYPNGGLTGAHCHQGQCRILQLGDCACGAAYEFGTVFVLDGVAYTCHDRGSAIGNRNLDIVYSNKQEAFAWGRRWREVEAWQKLDWYLYNVMSAKEKLLQ